jgi:hypothetical protein
VCSKGGILQYCRSCNLYLQTGTDRTRQLELFCVQVCKLHNLYSSPSISGMMMSRACSTNDGEEEHTYDTDGKARKKEASRKNKT